MHVHRYSQVGVWCRVLSFKRSDAVMKRQVMGLSSKMNFKKAYAQGTKQTF